MDYKNTLITFVDAADYFCPQNGAVRGMVNFAKSALVHYRGKGLRVVVVAQNACVNFRYDAALGEIPLVTGEEAKALLDQHGVSALALVLTNDNGQAAWKFNGTPRAFTLAFAIEKLLGEPDYRADHTNKDTLPYFDHTVPAGEYAYETKTSDEAGIFYVNTQADFDAIKNRTYQPGDTVYLARGKEFYGAIEPKGGGTPDKPVHLLSYGIGPRPIINAGRESGGIVLFNTQGWEMDGINIKHGRYWGIFVGSDCVEPTDYNHFVIRNCSVYEVGNEWPTTKVDAYSGPICFNMYDTRTGKGSYGQFNDITIDHCETYQTTRGEGIYIGGAFDARRSTNILIQNCFIHDVGLDGLLVMCGANVMIKDNVAFHTGISPIDVGYSPNSVWIWRCTGAVLEGNECSFAHSPIYAKDGGAFDVDFYCKDTLHEYNYAHDNDTYGIAVFGAGNGPGLPHPNDHITVKSIVRYNYFGNNQVVRDNGEVYFLTWNGGLIDGFEFYDNFIFSKPKDGKSPAISATDFDYIGDLPRFFRNNVIYSSIGYFMDFRATDKVEFFNNQYYSDAATLRWHWAGKDYATLEAFAQGAGTEKDGTFATTIPEPTMLKEVQ